MKNKNNLLRCLHAGGDPPRKGDSPCRRGRIRVWTAAWVGLLIFGWAVNGNALETEVAPDTDGLSETTADAETTTADAEMNPDAEATAEAEANTEAEANATFEERTAAAEVNPDAEASAQTAPDAKSASQETPLTLEEKEAQDEIESDYEPQMKRLIIPPFYQEKTDKYRLQLFFPIYFRKHYDGDVERSSLGILPFYWRQRSPSGNVDSVFPFYTRVRKPNSKADIVLQTYYQRGVNGYHFGLIPLLFFGKDTLKDKSYQLVPPLFWRFTHQEKSFLLAGIFYLHQNKQDYDVGIPPLFFAGRNQSKTYMTVLPPIFWRFTDELYYKSETVVPPVFFNTRENGWSFGLMPLLYLARDVEWGKTLVLPFYYGSRWKVVDKNGEGRGYGRSHWIIPLLSYYMKTPTSSQGGAAIFYQWYWKEGAFMRMYTPLVWRYGNERTRESATLIPPLFFQKTSPVEHKLMLGMLFWDFHEKFKSRTTAVIPFMSYSRDLYRTNWRTWVLPTFDIGRNKDEGKFHFRIHPLFYFGKAKDKGHVAVVPLWWDFRDKEDETLIFFPLYWNFKDLLHEDSTRIVFPLWWHFKNPRRENQARVVFPLYWDIERGKQDSRLTLGVPLFWRYRLGTRSTTGFMNVFVNKGELKGNKFWTFNLFPLGAFGHPPSPSGAYWSFLYGLVEWRRQGSSKRMKLFWIPFTLGKD